MKIHKAPLSGYPGIIRLRQVRPLSDTAVRVEVTCLPAEVERLTYWLSLNPRPERMPVVEVRAPLWQDNYRWSLAAYLEALAQERAGK